MLEIIAMVIILIVIIVLIIKYLYVQAHILSSREFRKTAEKKSFNKQITSPKISCDYCGCLIDTTKHTKCPNCGALYGEDKELKRRYIVNETAVEKMANVAANDAVSKAHKKGLETLKQLRVAIIAFVVVFILMLGHYIYADKTSYNPYKYRENEEVDTSSYRDYTLISSPEMTIMKREGVTLRLMSVYASTDNGIYNDSSFHYRVGFSLVNKRKEPIHISLKCVGINGRSTSRDYIYIYSYFKPNSEVLFYENVYGEWFKSIDEMVFGECSLKNNDGDLYNNNTQKTFKLNDTGYTAITDDKYMGNVVFENEMVRIRTLIKEDSKTGYDMWIENLSDHNFYIEASDLNIDHIACRSYILHKAGLPAGYTLHHDSVRGLGDEFENRSDNAIVDLSLSFSDPVDPKNDFSTGYFTLK